MSIQAVLSIIAAVLFVGAVCVKSLPLRIALAVPCLVLFGLAVRAWDTEHISNAAVRHDVALVSQTPVYPGATLVSKQTFVPHGLDLIYDPLHARAATVTAWYWRGPRGVETTAIAQWYTRRLQASGWSTSIEGAGQRTAATVLASRADGESISFVLGGGPPDVPPSETSVLIEALPVATPNG